MMKRRFTYLFVLALAACTTETLLPSEMTEETQEYTSVRMSLPPAVFDDCPETKNEALLGSSISYVWSATDTVGIFPGAGSQIYFSMATGAGQTSAKFDGGGWALKKGSDYYSYFPFVPDFYIDKRAIPVTFVGQNQTGNGDPTHAYLGNYCYMVAKGVADEATGSLFFNYERVGVLFRIRIPVQAGVYTSLSVRVSDKILAESGTIDAVNITKTIDDPVYTDKITLSLNDVVMQSDGTLVGFLMLPPFNVLGSQVNFELVKEDGSVVIASAVGKNFVLGKTYDNAPKFSVGPVTSEIDAEGGSVSFDIHSSGTSSYTVASDAEWLVLTSEPTSGSAKVIAKASANTGKPRTAHIIVSETVTLNGSPVVLDNVITVTQNNSGLNIGVGDWESGEDQGGVAS